MCRVVSTSLPGNTSSPGRARSWTEMWLDSWDIRDEGVVTLLVSELVTNAVKHTRAAATLTLAVATGMIEVGVSDNGSSRRVIPAPRGVGPLAVDRTLRESGRGLIIVEALSDDWGVAAAGPGKQVWFRRPVASDWPYTASCVCGADNAAAHRLPSGGNAVAVPGPWDRRSR